MSEPAEAEVETEVETTPEQDADEAENEVMTKRSPETFRDLCDVLVERPFYAAAARKLGLSVPTILRWIYESQQRPDEYTFEWQGHVGPLDQHIVTAMRLSAHLLESKARHDSIHGTEQVVIYQGAIQYEIDPTLIGKDLDECLFLTGYADRYKRDANRACLPLRVITPPSDAMRIHMLKAFFPAVHGDKSEVNVNHGGSVRVLNPHPVTAKPVAQIEPKPIKTADEKLVDIRARMRAEAEAHLSRTDRVTAPRGVVRIIPAEDPVIDDGKKRAGQQRYTGTQAAGDGVERTGLGADPRSPDGRSRGFKQS